MADDNPYAKWAVQPTQPVVNGNPFSKYVTGPSVGEDLLNGVPTGLAEGGIALVGMPGDLQKVGKAASDKATEKGINPFSALSDTFANSTLGKFLKDESAKTAKLPAAQTSSGDLPGSYEMPTSSDIQKKVEGVTGPFYQSQTPIGKAAQTAAQVAPSLLMGGEGLLSTAAKATGAGVTSEAAGEGAKALKGYLPDAAQPWAEPVSRALGATAGIFAPAAVRRAVTPLPMAPEQAATVTALKQTDPELVKTATAGQLTDIPGLRSVEGRAPKFAGQEQTQEKAFTQGLMGRMGVDGLATPENVAKGKTIGDELGNLRRANVINQQEYPTLLKNVQQLRQQLVKTIGNENLDAFDTLADKIKFGASGKAAVQAGLAKGKQVQPGGLTGGFYDTLRQEIQSGISGAGSGGEATGLGRLKTLLDNAFHSSVTPETSARIKELENQYFVANTIKDRTPKFDAQTGLKKDTITPQELAGSLSNAEVNTNRNDLAKLANSAPHVMQPLPEPSTHISPTVQIASAVGNSLLHGGAGYHLGGPAVGLSGAGEGFLGGLFGAEPAINASKDMMARILASKVPQAYLKNQLWKPGAVTSSDPAMIARLLMSPPDQALISDKGK